MKPYYPAECAFGQPTESGDGTEGVSDPRYWNEYRRNRRITGPLAQRIIALAKKKYPNRMIYGGDGTGPDRLYQVPTAIIDEVEPRQDSPPQTWK